MTPADPFARLLATSPNADSTIFAVYADWLDDHDDPRGPAVRAEAAARLCLPPADVHGVLDAGRHLGARFAPRQLSALATLPWSEEVLRRCAGTHLLIAGCPLSILDLRRRRPDHFMWGSEPNWYDREPFARSRRVGVRWHLLRKAVLPGSTHKLFAQQTAMLENGERLPRARDVASAVILHHLVTGERLLEGVSTRCADRTAHGARVSLGGICKNGWYIGPEWQDYRSGFVGLLPCR